MTPYNDSVIVVEFVVYLPYNDTYVDSEMWIGAAAHLGNSKIWAAERSATVINTTFSDMVSLCHFVVNSFSTRLLSSCTDEYAHTYDLSTY